MAGKMVVINDGHLIDLGVILGNQHCMPKISILLLLGLDWRLDKSHKLIVNQKVVG